MAQTVAFFAGFETGDSKEIATLGAGASIQTSTVRTGGYALKATTANLTTFTTALSTTQSVIRFYLFMVALPGNLNQMLEELTTGGTARLFVEVQSSGLMRVRNPGATLGLTATNGTAVLAPGAWYRIEVALDLAAGGVVQVYVIGVLDINITHTNDVSASPTGRYAINGETTALWSFDDIRIDVGGLTPIGDGQCIARQPIVGGTPTYDQWTKSSGTDAGALWNATPFDAVNFCSDSTSLHAQTAVIAPFSATQSGHGSQIVSPGDTINAAKTALVFKRATGGSPSIRRRVNGVDTDTVVTGATTDAYRDDGIWTTAGPNLDLLEAGMVKAADANLTTVEDVWVIIDYSPLGSGGYVPQTGFYGRPENYTTPAQSARQFPAAAQQFAVYPEARGNVPSPATPQGWHAVFPERIARKMPPALQQFEAWPRQGAIASIAPTGWAAIFPERGPRPKPPQHDFAAAFVPYPAPIVITYGWHAIAPEVLPRRPMPAIGWTVPVVPVQATPTGWTVTLPEAGRPARRPAGYETALTPPATAPQGWGMVWPDARSKAAARPAGAETMPVPSTRTATAFDSGWDAPARRPRAKPPDTIIWPPEKVIFATPGNTALWDDIGVRFRRIAPPPADFFRMFKTFPRIASQPNLLGVSANPTLFGVSTSPTLLGQSTDPTLIGEV